MGAPGIDAIRTVAPVWKRKNTMPILVLKAHDVSTEARTPQGTREGGRWTKLKPGEAHPDGHAPSTQPERQVVKDRGLPPIPPASWGLWVNPDTTGRVQATWFDGAGRKQYRYSATHTESAAENKFNKVHDFSKKLPDIRRKVAGDLRGGGISRAKVAAAVISIIDQTCMRVGSEEYAEEHGTYGASSLRKNHVSVDGGTVRFHFSGKHSKEWDRELHDTTVATVVKRLLKVPGDKLFQYEANGKIIPITESHVNSYLRQFGVTAKQFRTYHASRMAADLLKQAGKPKTEADAKKTISRVCKDVAEALGNTPAVCRSSYINPAILNAYAAATSGKGQQLTMLKSLSAGETAFNQLLDEVKAGIDAGTIADADPFPDDLEKSHVRGYTRQTKSGKTVQVQAHETHRYKMLLRSPGDATVPPVDYEVEPGRDDSEMYGFITTKHPIHPADMAHYTVAQEPEEFRIVAPGQRRFDRTMGIVWEYLGGGEAKVVGHLGTSSSAARGYPVGTVKPMPNFRYATADTPINREAFGPNRGSLERPEGYYPKSEREKRLEEETRQRHEDDARHRETQKRQTEEAEANGVYPAIKRIYADKGVDAAVYAQDHYFAHGLDAFKERYGTYMKSHPGLVLRLQKSYGDSHPAVKHGVMALNNAGIRTTGGGMGDGPYIHIHEAHVHKVKAGRLPSGWRLSGTRLSRGGDRPVTPHEGRALAGAFSKSQMSMFNEEEPRPAVAPAPKPAQYSTKSPVGPGSQSTTPPRPKTSVIPSHVWAKHQDPKATRAERQALYNEAEAEDKAGNARYSKINQTHKQWVDHHVGQGFTQHETRGAHFYLKNPKTGSTLRLKDEARRYAPIAVKYHPSNFNKSFDETHHPRAHAGETGKYHGGEFVPAQHTSLFGDDEPDMRQKQHTSPVTYDLHAIYPDDGGVHEIPMTAIEPDWSQDRNRDEFTDAKIGELAESMKRGLDQPISVRPIVHPNGEPGFRVIAGERRYTAAKLLGWNHIRAQVRDVTDEIASDIQLRENTARKDLNPMEEAKAFQTRVDKFKKTPEQIAKIAGKSVAYVNSRLALNNLTSGWQTLLMAGDIKIGWGEMVSKLSKPSQDAILAEATKWPEDKWTTHNIRIAVQERAQAESQSAWDFDDDPFSGLTTDDSIAGGKIDKERTKRARDKAERVVSAMGKLLDELAHDDTGKLAPIAMAHKLGAWIDILERQRGSLDELITNAKAAKASRDTTGNFGRYLKTAGIKATSDEIQSRVSEKAGALQNQIGNLRRQLNRADERLAGLKGKRGMDAQRKDFTEKRKELIGKIALLEDQKSKVRSVLKKAVDLSISCDDRQETVNRVEMFKSIPDIYLCRAWEEARIPLQFAA